MKMDESAVVVADTKPADSLGEKRHDFRFFLTKVLHANEFYLFLVLLGISLLIQARSGQFFTLNNLVDLGNAMVVPGLFAIGAHMVLVSGGIDVSFPALAALSVYSVMRFLVDIDYRGPFLIALLAMVLAGALLGALNGLFTSQLTVPTLIITLGTMNVFSGIMQGALGAVQISRLPEPIDKFGRAVLIRVENVQQGTQSVLPMTFLFFLLVLVVIGFLMKFTLFGRALYAMGGDEQAAIRAGFRVKWIKFWLYVIVGMIAAIAGLMSVSVTHQMNPTDLLGTEMMVIAAVVLGGTSITGGKGSLIGVIMGTMMIAIIQTNMIMAGIPTTGKRFVLGLMIIIGTGISAVQLMRSRKRQRLTAE